MSKRDQKPDHDSIEDQHHTKKHRERNHHNLFFERKEKREKKKIFVFFEIRKIDLIVFVEALPVDILHALKKSRFP